MVPWYERAEIIARERKFMRALKKEGHKIDGRFMELLEHLWERRCATDKSNSRDTVDG